MALTVQRPPVKNTVIGSGFIAMRIQIIAENFVNGRRVWQKEQDYGERNSTELGVQHYIRILGRTIRARKYPIKNKSVGLAVACLTNDNSWHASKFFRCLRRFIES